LHPSRRQIAEPPAAGVLPGENPFPILGRAIQERFFVRMPRLRVKNSYV
jgi:hypothetical protein